MKINTDPKKIEELLTRSVEKVIDKNHLKKRLLRGEKLRVKFGVDPSRPDIHLGHTVPLRKLGQFQELGHEIVLIIGDFTGRIGDPSGRSKTRPQLSPSQVEENAKTYLEQVKKVIDIKKIEIQRNSQWYEKMKLEDIIKLAGLFTVARILERDDFTNRIKKGIDIHLHEVLYPILQAYDSIAIGADVEIGGTDQTFNMLTGRTLQKRLCKSEQDVMTVPLLIGLDGKEKMSKSLNNYIGVNEAPGEQYGKVMSIPDNLIIHYFELVTQVPLEEIKAIKRDLEGDKLNPRDAKARLAFEIVKMYHSQKEAKKEEKEFNRVFREKKVPRQMPTFVASKKIYPICELLTQANLAPSKSEAKRLVLQGGVKLDQKVIEDWQQEVELKDEMVIQVGKRKFVKIKLGNSIS